MIGDNHLFRYIPRYSYFPVYHTRLPPSQSDTRYSYLQAHHFPRFQNLKNPSATRNADCRDLTRLCLRLCIGVKLTRAASGPLIAYYSAALTPELRRWRSFNPLSRRAGIDRTTTRPTAEGCGVEHWDEAVRCLSVDPVLSGCVV